MKKMMTIVLTGILVLAGRAAWAQDPLAVGGEMYKLVLENERVRVMEVTFTPGSKIATHSHPDHLAYILSGGKLLLSYPDGTTTDLEVKPGDALWIPAETHSGENVGGTEVKVLVIELKENATNKVDDSFQAKME